MRIKSIEEFVSLFIEDHKKEAVKELRLFFAVYTASQLYQEVYTLDDLVRYAGNQHCVHWLYNPVSSRLISSKDGWFIDIEDVASMLGVK